MCGLHWVINSDSYATGVEKFVKDAFIANQVRGMHSSGIMQVEKNRAIVSYKDAVCGSLFVQDNQAQPIIRDAPRQPLTVGHVRHATVGSHDKRNAHPFTIVRQDHSKVIGVHNGTLRGWQDKKNADGMEVDSHWAFSILAEEGPFDAFEYFNGAFAMIWFDSTDPDSVFMARNEERPLHYMTTPDSKTIIGASELGMLGWLADRNNIARSKEAGFRYLLPNKIYKFSLKNVGEYTVFDMPKYNPKTKIIKPVSKPVASTVTEGEDFRKNVEPFRDKHTSLVPSGYRWSRYMQDEDQQATLLEVKEALRYARYNVPDDSS